MLNFTGENPTTISINKCKKTISASSVIKNTVAEHGSSQQHINCRRLIEFKIIMNSITWNIPKRKVSALSGKAPVIHPITA